MTQEKISVPGLSVCAVLLTALSLSIGWGVRGNWGHEYGAMIPGALSAMAAVLLSGREDWRRRVIFFAFFGALGWSFGGSMSYGIVIGYTHSHHLPSVAYGFACLFVIGFLWGVIGGVGTALPAIFNRERLTEFFAPICAVFAAWWMQEIAQNRGWLSDSRFNWYDTDWIAALLALVVLGIYAAVRRRWNPACSMILHMAGGWWAAFLILVVGLGIRMTPPRGDNWAGCLGMALGLWIYCLRNGMISVVRVSLQTGLFAGFGFSAANLLKLMCIATGWIANWHSVLEQMFGFISGVGVAVALGYVSTRWPRLDDESNSRSWTQPFSIAFVLLLITYVNIQKNIESVWLPNKVVLASMYGLPIEWWFNLAYAAIALVVLILVIRHSYSPLPLIPPTWLGKGQAFYLLFLWWIVIGNLSRYLPFDPIRLITEGVIHINACICTLLVLLCPRKTEIVPAFPQPDDRKLIFKTLGIGLVVIVAAIGIQTVITMGLFDAPDGNAHFRFGPQAWIPPR